MNFTKEFIENLKENINIVSYISQYTNLKKSGRVYTGFCPNPYHEDSDPSFRVWDDTNSWACMGCHHGSKGGSNFGSDIIAFVQWIDNINFVDAVIKLSDYAGIKLPSKDNNPYKKERLNKNKEYAIKSHNNVVLIESYLEKRGLRREDIIKYRIGYDGERVIFPLVDRFNNIIGFNKRAYGDYKGISKYINSKNSDIFNKSEFLYNFNNLNYRSKYIIVTEGPFDSIVPSRYSVENVVSTLGASVTDEQIDIISNTNLIPILCFDGDDSGNKAIVRASEKLSKKNVYNKVLLMPEGMDLADLSNVLKDKTGDYIINNSVSYNQFKIDKILTSYNSRLNEIKIEYIPKLKEALNSIDHELERKVISDKIELEMNIKL